MGNALASHRSVFKGNIISRDPPLMFPVAVQLKQEIFGLPGHYFHEGCGERITMPWICPAHPDEELPQVYTAIQVSEGEFIRLDKDVKKSLFGKDLDYIEIISSHKISLLPQLVNDEQFVVNRIFELIPQRVANKGWDQRGQVLIDSLLERMRIKKRFLLLRVPFDSFLRYAVLMSNGTIYSLLHEEEIRESVNIPESSIIADPKINKAFDNMLANIDQPFPDVISCADIIQNVTAFLNSHAPSRQGKKVGAIVTLDDLLESV